VDGREHPRRPAILIVDGWCAIEIHHCWHVRARIKLDYSDVNGIDHELLRSTWMNHLRQIAAREQPAPLRVAQASIAVASRA
jgi:hypothetical protein